MTKSSHNSLMRNIGQCLGYITKGFKADVSTPDTYEVRRETSTEQRATPAGPVTLRRTTIEEISLPAPSSTDATADDPISRRTPDDDPATNL